MKWRALALLLLLAACGSSPKTQFFTLTPVPPQSGKATASGPPLQVGHIALPGELDREALVTRGAGNEVQVASQQHWVAPLNELVQRALSDDLRDRLGAGRVLAPGDPAPPGTRTVAVNVQQFSGDASGQVTLRADWAVATGNPPKPGAIHPTVLHEAAGSPAPGDIAAAMSRAVGQLADQIAGAL